jgi:hypothetical protein
MSNTVNATTSCTGSQLSLSEQALGLDRNDLKSDGKLVSLHTEFEVTKFKPAILGDILTSDKFIRFDLLARNVIKEGFAHNTKVQVGSSGRAQEIKTPDGRRFRQIGTSYYGDIG